MSQCNAMEDFKKEVEYETSFKMNSKNDVKMSKNTLESSRF